jgi:hypothetical protein
MKKFRIEKYFTSKYPNPNSYGLGEKKRQAKSRLFFARRSLVNLQEYMLFGEKGEILFIAGEKLDTSCAL